MKKEVLAEKSKVTEKVSASAKKAAVASVSAEKEALKEQKQESTKKVTVKKNVKSTEVKKVKEKTEGKVELYVQFSNQEVVTDKVLERVKQAYMTAGNKMTENDDIRIYIKPEENKAYYVVNNEYSSDIVLYE